MEEIWKDIKDYEGLYQISSLGRVKSLWYGKERILKLGKDKDNYLTTNLCKEGKIKIFKVHRLVAQTFIPNPNNYPCVNHKDENKQNNTVENLEWCTHKYNVNYGTAIERRTDKLLNREDLSKKVYQYTKDGEFVKEWESTKECERKNGFYHSTVSACCNGKLKTYKGFIWKYK